MFSQREKLHLELTSVMRLISSQVDASKNNMELMRMFFLSYTFSVIHYIVYIIVCVCVSVCVDSVNINFVFSFSYVYAHIKLLFGSTTSC